MVFGLILIDQWLTSDDLEKQIFGLRVPKSSSKLTDVTRKISLLSIFHLDFEFGTIFTFYHKVVFANL
jgi:hypothetical protein